MAKRKQSDPLEGTMEAALRPGDFIPYNAGWSFVADLEEVKKQIEKRINVEPARAVSLFETFLAGCWRRSRNWMIRVVTSGCSLSTYSAVDDHPF